LNIKVGEHLVEDDGAVFVGQSGYIPQNELELLLKVSKQQTNKKVTQE